MSNKIKQCKTCGKEIASSAKTCPNCGAKNSKVSVKKIIAIFLLFFVIMGIIGSTVDDSQTGDTDETNRMNPNGSVVEFVVDTKKLEDLPRRMGDISYANDWKSKVVNIKVYEKVEIF